MIEIVEVIRVFVLDNNNNSNSDYNNNNEEYMTICTSPSIYYTPKVKIKHRVTAYFSICYILNYCYEY